MSDLLTEQELFELTKKSRGSAQARVLAHMGIDHKPRPDGTLAVLRAARDEALGLRRSRTASQSNEINWS